MKRSASSQQEKRTSVSRKRTLIRRRRKGGRWYEVLPDGSERQLPVKRADWSRLEAMSEAEKAAAAGSDPDAGPLTIAELKRMRRSPFAKALSENLELSA